jgi:hypothetical protein
MLFILLSSFLSQINAMCNEGSINQTNQCAKCRADEYCGRGALSALPLNASDVWQYFINNETRNDWHDVIVSVSQQLLCRSGA